MTANGWVGSAIRAKVMLGHYLSSEKSMVTHSTNTKVPTRESILRHFGEKNSSFFHILSIHDVSFRNIIHSIDTGYLFHQTIIQLPER